MPCPVASPDSWFAINWPRGERGGGEGRGGEDGGGGGGGGEKGGKGGKGGGGVDVMCRIRDRGVEVGVGDIY